MDARKETFQLQASRLPVVSAYVFDHAWEAKRARLTGLELGLDAGTIRHLEALRVGTGWRCWEIGGGGGVAL